MTYRVNCSIDYNDLKFINCVSQVIIKLTALNLNKV